jgi:hypothetical protein
VLGRLVRQRAGHSNSTPGAAAYLFRAMGSSVVGTYTSCMSKYLLRVLGIPTGIIALSGLFVLVQRYCDQTMVLQLTGLFARLVVLVSFVYFAYQWRRTVWAYWNVDLRSTSDAQTMWAPSQSTYNWTSLGRASRNAARVTEG